MNKSKYSHLLKEIEEDYKNIENITKNDKVLIIDGMNAYIRTFSASPALNTDGDHVGGFYGFLNTLKGIINTLEPTRVIIIFDGKGGSQKRRKLYSDYKSGRAIKNKLNRALDISVNHEQHLLRLQFARLIEYLDCLPVTIMSYDYVEADDVIAYIAKSCLQRNVIIYSNDKDYFQLIDDRISVFFPAKMKLYKKQDIVDEYGILPENFIWHKVIIGDKSDKIPGIKGIGKSKFTENFSFLKDLPYDLDQFKILINEAQDDKIFSKMKSSIDIIDRNYTLMQLFDIDISANIKSKIMQIVDGEIQEFNRVKLKKMMMDDKLGDLIKNFELWVSGVFDKLNLYRNRNDR